jgi:AcrR family transcriptional regulator
MAAQLASRSVRADARRNRDRILAAAGEAFSEHGPHLPLDEIARRAEVSPATLFRHFANRDELVAAVVERRLADEVEPVIASALAADDPWEGLVAVIGATLRVGTASPAWRDTLAMAREQGLVRRSRDRLLGPLAVLLERAQAQGQVRDDVGIADLAPIMRMLRALVVTSGDLADDAWLRYLSLLLRR